MGGRGRIQLSGGGVGSGKFRFWVGPQELQDRHPKYTAHLHDNVVHPSLRLFEPWIRPPPPLRLFCRGGKATLATPGYTMVRYRATPGFARQQTKINVTPLLFLRARQRNPPSCFDFCVLTHEIGGRQIKGGVYVDFMGAH